MKLVGLSRQIAFSMMAIALGVILLVIFTAYVFYYFWDKYWPENVPVNSLVPTVPELFWIFGTTIVGLVLAVWVALNLSKRILAPLNSLAAGIRSLAQGDLSARAVADDESMGEAFQLATDFNHLAEKLQKMTEEQRFWNAAIAHELRTPVTILRGRLQGLVDGVFQPDIKQFKSLLTQVEGLNRLIEDMRVISLADSGNLYLNRVNTDIKDEIDSAIQFSGIFSADSKFTSCINIDAMVVFCDPVRVRQAMLALLDNAKKYSSPGRISINFEKKNQFYQLSVQDEGPGISSDFLPHIFTPFMQSPDTKRSGSGLGLAVVSAIAKAHGGYATCALSAEGGTIITLCWPDKAHCE
ncbi:ATP-binding protein [Proteus mirabilis]|uniref:ATP-binding protein n=1 Tax=Proteus mirabilis TaxID=584 RepID=UPI001C47929A|nr:ATP-binding protein [Proteus mirabilis]QXL79546.1 Signal transduction histidine-protein kinase BaeS [Proteus mirabilis]HDZ7415318.1 HAMP domain-containing protein [Escherichia coli]